MATQYLYADIPGSGPKDKHCSDCAHRARLASKHAHICAKIKDITGANGGPHRNTLACRYFKEKQE